MSTEIEIVGRKIGAGHPCFIIAEAGVNHNGDINLAKKLIEVAADAGADAVKFQLYSLKEQVCRVAPTANYQKKLTGATSMLEMGMSYDLPWTAHLELVKHCNQVGIEYMASCFDPSAVDFLSELGCDCIKVGSGEITNYPLLAHMAATGKPILLSTGMSTLEDVAGAVEHIHSYGSSPLALFQCISNYPADPATINLRAMQALAAAFHVPVGYSDHTVGSTVAVAALALGASIIEKHFTLEKTLPGPDHAMSLNPIELREFIGELRAAEASFGDGIKRPDPSELNTLTAARRSLVSTHLITKGTRLADADVTLKRPATGIDPRLWEFARGRTVSSDIPEDVPITWEMLV